MKIALIHDFLTKIGGAEKVFLEIIKLYPDAQIFTLVYDEEGTKGLFRGKNIITSDLQNKPMFLRKRPKLMFANLAKAIEEFDLSTYDLVISDSNSFAHGVITRPETPHICYCYSPMRYAWDWSAEYAKENHIGFGLLGLYIRKKIYDLRQWDFYAAERVDLWIAISKNVQKRIRKYYRKESLVIYPPVDVERFKLDKENREEYFLVVSRLSPYKKIDTVVKAFNQLGQSLKIVGEGADLNKLEGIAKDNIEFLGWQNDTMVAKLMANAKGLIFPGEEDFGLTPVEAMSCGTPVIGLNRGGTTETIIEKESGIFYDGSVEDLVDKVNSFNNVKWDLDFLRRHAEKFSTERFAKEFTETVDKFYKSYSNGRRNS